MAKLKLSKRFLDGVKGTDKGGTRYFDTELTGFYVRAYPNGRRVFGVLYGPKGRQRQLTVGLYGVLTLDQARDAARRLLSKAALGQDPAQEKAAIAATPIWREWSSTYLKDAEARKKSWKEDKRYLGWADQAWGPKLITHISSEDIQRQFLRIVEEHGKTTANRWLASVRACFSSAWRLGKVKDNPARFVRLLPENLPRERVLSNEEVNHLSAAIANLPNPHDRAAFQLLLQTGARLSEVLRATWSDIDLQGGLWVLPESKSGKRQVIPLAEETVALLEDLPQLGPFVIPGRDPKKGRYDLKKPWKALLNLASASFFKEWSDEHPEGPDPPDGFLQGLTIHDIRRTFGLAVARTAGLHVASKLLRHSDIRITERVYAPLGIDELRQAAEKVAIERGKVIKLKKA